MQQADWQQSDSQVNTLAVATRAAEAGNRHSIVWLTASYSAAFIGLLQIKIGGVVKIERYVHNACDIDLTAAIRGGNGQAVSAELQAGGAGVTGKLTISGLTA